MGQECSISRGGPYCTVEVYMSEESEEGVTVLRQGGGAAPRVRALNLERESCEHLRWTHLEQAQHCTDRQVTFSAHTEQGKKDQGWDERYRSSRGDEEGQEKRKNRRLIWKKP